MRHSRAMSGLTLVGLIVGTLLVLGAAAWTVADLTCSRRLERELASLRADGYPLTLAEVKPKPVPDASNAATIYMPLFEVNFDPKRPPTYSSSGNGKCGLDRFAVDKTDLPNVLKTRNVIESPPAQAALAQLKRASALPICVFPLRWEDTYNALFPHLAQFRQATRLVCAQAVLLNHQGRRAEALDWLVVSLRMADQASEDPSLVAQLVAIAMRTITDQAARDLITDADLSPALARPLYDQLGRAEFMQPYQRAMEMELVLGLTVMEQLGRRPQELRAVFGSGGMPYPEALLRLLTWGPGRTWFKQQEVNYARYMHQALPAIAKPYRDSISAMPPVPSRGIGNALTNLLVPVYGRVTMKRDQSLAATRLLQIVLALKAQKHSLGTYPSALAGLVWQPPTEDPFSGKPFVYQPQGSGFVLYSIGPNLKDDGGKEPSKPGKIQEEGDMVWRCKR
jgi:hypothetical protein